MPQAHPNRVCSTFGIRFPLAFDAPDLIEARAQVAHGIAGVGHAVKAAEAGVDALIAEPTESGGDRGANEISMRVLIPAVARAVSGIPLVAAGSAADRAGLVAVMALGAEGADALERFTSEMTSR